MPDHIPPHHHEAHIHEDGTDHREEIDCPGDEEADDGKPTPPTINSGSGGHGGSQPPPPPAG